MQIRLIATIFFISILVSNISAVSPPGDDMQDLLDSALTDAQCRVSFETGFMNEIIDTFPFTDSLLNPRIDELDSDGSQLERYANQGDAKNYSKYIQETFSMHLKHNEDAVKDSFESLNESGMDKNETKDAMESLASTYKSMRDGQESCFDVEAHANLVFNHYNDSLTRYYMRANNLSDRGFNSSNLLDLASDAKSEVILPLYDGIDSASNSSELRMIMGRYCMDDGCGNGTNFHMSAKFETMRLGNLMGAMAPKATELGLGTNVSSVWSSLNSAKSKIDSWNNKNVSRDQLDSVWTDIHSAAKGSHDIFIALNSSAGGD